ncbi:SCP2 sterol-binding domain-containing protein [Chromobacterium violaceum]|uniref:ubiquinone anaerobic biosynthesis accessory factor UbiT n=1 Tax=Chromobacterium violaceum TaxID=536 RepID=UPI001B327789|nr:SCP2 sterol-binding domain-containing protein [Chromobacterium violaceum]MBP4050798.1 SCP2 sterol-binding domain-containing protein [Chromobacterium violaceum]
MRVPELTFPTAGARLLSRLPATPPSWLLASLLNLLQRRGVLPVDMDLLDGKRFEVHIRDAGLRLRFAASGGAFTTSDAEPDLRLSANGCDFARMMLREEDPDTLFFQRKLAIEGDTELGLIVKNLLDSVDWSQTPLAGMMAV